MANRAATVYQKASTSNTMADSQIQQFTVGKIDAGIAVLISDSVHLIEFPSLLLPSGVGPGSIVNISCSRNVAAERASTASFWDLQNDIFTQFGVEEPVPPQLRLRNTTQTSVTLEWDKLELASAKLLGLAIWRNGQRLANIPNPLSNTSSKLSGLSLDSDYTFHLVMKTTAGTFTSPVIKVHTHTISDTSGISVCFGLVQPQSLLDEAQAALGDMKAKYNDKIEIDTTHFVATSSASVASPRGGPGVEYQKALQLSIVSLPHPPLLLPPPQFADHSIFLHLSSPSSPPSGFSLALASEKWSPSPTTVRPPPSASPPSLTNVFLPPPTDSVGTTNHAASISSAQLVSPTSTSAPAQPQPKLPSQQQAARRAILEEGAVAGSLGTVPELAPEIESGRAPELAEEEPDAPPKDQDEVEPDAPPKDVDEVGVDEQEIELEIELVAPSPAQPEVEEPPVEAKEDDVALVAAPAPVERELEVSALEPADEEVMLEQVEASPPPAIEKEVVSVPEDDVEPEAPPQDEIVDHLEPVAEAVEVPEPKVAEPEIVEPKVGSPAEPAKVESKKAKKTRKAREAKEAAAAASKGDGGLDELVAGNSGVAKTEEGEEEEDDE